MRDRHTVAIWLGTIVVALLPSLVAAYSSNPAALTGRTNRDGGTGCASCHALDPGVNVMISGPTSLSAGASATYTVTAMKAGVGSGTNMGMAAAADDAGSLSESAANLVVVNGEVIHDSSGGALNQTDAGGSASYSFTFTMPAGAVAGTNHRLYAVARLGGTNGYNHAANFTVSAVAPLDTTPDAFSFVDQTNVQLSTAVTSNTLTITGINSSAAIAVSGDSTSQYSVGCTGTFTNAAGTISNGETVCVRHTSSAANGISVDTILTVGGVSDTFTSTTVSLVPDTTPDTFSFVDQTGVATSTQVTSAPITITGINTPAAIGVSGDPSSQYSVSCSGAFTSAPSTVNNNQTVCVRHTSASTLATAVDTTLTVGGVGDTFTSTTVAGTPPIITSTAPSGAIFSGAPFTYVVTATGNPAASFSATGLPTGLTINSSTGLISGAPGQTGSFPITITAANGVNPSATQTFTMQVVPSGAASLTISNVTIARGPDYSVSGPGCTPRTLLGAPGVLILVANGGFDGFDCGLNLPVAALDPGATNVGARFPNTIKIGEAVLNERALISIPPPPGIPRGDGTSLANLGMTLSFNVNVPGGATIPMTFVGTAGQYSGGTPAFGDPTMTQACSPGGNAELFSQCVHDAALDLAITFAAQGGNQVTVGGVTYNLSIPPLLFYDWNVIPVNLAVAALPGTAAVTIPLMSHWGIVLLSAVLAFFGVIAVRCGRGNTGRR